MRKLVMAIIGAAVLGAAAPASAMVTHLEGSDVGRIVDPNATVQVGGWIRCTDGQTYEIRLRVRQAEAKANGFASGACTGAIHRFAIDAVVVEGTFHDGPGAYDGTATTSDLDEQRFAVKVHLFTQA